MKLSHFDQDRQGNLNQVHSNQKGFTLIELLIVMAIIGILTSIAIPVFAQYKARAYNAQSKAELHNILIACKGYWADTGPNGDCTVSTITSPTYGYQLPGNMTMIVSGNETTFTASVTNKNTDKSFTMDSKGAITP